jgi:Mg/Co/Ni transporter MgtE
MRQRKVFAYDVEDGTVRGDDFRASDLDLGESDQSLLVKYKHLQQQHYELENKYIYLQKQFNSYSNLNNLNLNEKKYDEPYASASSSLSSPSSSPSPGYNYSQIITDRGSWLIGLLIFQSFSSIILSRYEGLLNQHPILVSFLTMLIGAGGNAGGQATVRMIREIALGNLTPANRWTYIYHEALIALILSLLMGTVGFLRVVLSSNIHTSSSEVLTIVMALMIIVFTSIILGTVLPLILEAVRVDPAHSSTSIQVLMDILGVLLVCSVASFLL